MAKWRLLCPVEGNVKWCNHLGNSMEVLNRIKNRIAVWSRNPVPGYLPKRIESWVLKRDLNCHVCSSVIYSGQVSKEWKQATCPMTDEQINKMWYIPRVECHSALEGKETLSQGYSIDEPWASHNTHTRTHTHAHACASAHAHTHTRVHSRELPRVVRSYRKLNGGCQGLGLMGIVVSSV